MQPAKASYNRNTRHTCSTARRSSTKRTNAIKYTHNNSSNYKWRFAHCRRPRGQSPTAICTTTAASSRPAEPRILRLERVLSESQLTQVQSLVQATINDTIERTATAAAQAAVNAFNGASPPAANVPDRNAPDEDTNSRSVQELLRSSAPDGTSRIDLAIASTSQQRPSDSVHELPAKLVKEILSGEFMELSKLLPQNFNSLQPFYDEPLTLTLEKLCHKGK